MAGVNEMKLSCLTICLHHDGGGGERRISTVRTVLEFSVGPDAGTEAGIAPGLDLKFSAVLPFVTVMSGNGASGHFIMGI